MKNKIIVLAVLFILILPASAFAKVFPGEGNVTKDKQWTVRFNLPVDESTLKENITVKDGKGTAVGINLSLGQDKKTVTVTPTDKYSPGEVYTLTVGMGVKSSGGWSLKETASKDFTIKQDEVFRVMTSAFNSGGTIPAKYCLQDAPGGMNTSIPIVWSGLPEGTKSIAVLMYDLHPIAGNWVHWAVTDIPPTASGLAEGASGTSNMPAGAVELYNDFGTKGYGGPCPPQGSGRHEYKIIVYALSTESLGLSGMTSLSQFQSAVSGKVLAKSEISGYFEQ